MTGARRSCQKVDEVMHMYSAQRPLKSAMHSRTQRRVVQSHGLIWLMRIAKIFLPGMMPDLACYRFFLPNRAFAVADWPADNSFSCNQHRTQSKFRKNTPGQPNSNSQEAIGALASKTLLVCPLKTRACLSPTGSLFAALSASSCSHWGILVGQSR